MRLQVVSEHNEYECPNCDNYPLSTVFENRSGTRYVIAKCSDGHCWVVLGTTSDDTPFTLRVYGTKVLNDLRKIGSLEDIE
ncbi:hypothetical protein LCGC14_0342890 [marine sediment metagenome]|uniref:Uncharacterized protein n=1 Tax=marine sediment metagenome TaxID=412755 RepID=A0A0F9W0C1_9ZZZZ